jgi:hypothetical protein
MTFYAARKRCTTVKFTSHTFWWPNRGHEIYSGVGRKISPRDSIVRDIAALPLEQSSHSIDTFLSHGRVQMPSQLATRPFFVLDTTCKLSPTLLALAPKRRNRSCCSRFPTSFLSFHQWLSEIGSWQNF